MTPPTRLRLCSATDGSSAWMELSDELDGKIGVFRGPAVLEGRKPADTDWVVQVFVGERLLDTLALPLQRVPSASVDGVRGVVTARYSMRSHILWADVDSEEDETPPSWRLTLAELRAPLDS